MQPIKSKDIIVSYLQKNGSSPRVLLSKETGLTKAAITQITNELIKEGILIEKGEIQPTKTTTDEKADIIPQKRGRRKVLIGINENYRLVMGMTVLKDGVYAGLCNLNGEILQKVFVGHTQEGRQGLRELCVKTYEYLRKENCITDERLLGLGICISDDCEGIFESEISPEVLTRLKTELSHAIDVPIVSCRLAEGLLLAQRLFMRNRRMSFDSAVMLLIGAQTGISLFANGKIYKGYSNQAGGLPLITQTLKDFESIALNNSDEKNSEELKRLFELIGFFDPQMVFVFGDFLSPENVVLEKMNLSVFGVLGQKKKGRQYEILACDVKKDAVFLAGSAVLASQYFFNF